MSVQFFSSFFPPGITPVLAVVSVSLGVTFLLMAASGGGVWGWLVWRKFWRRRQEEHESALTSYKEKSALQVRRNRVLEKILAVSATMNTTRNPQDLYTRIVDAASDIGGFQRVVLYLWSENTEAFEARGFAGVSEAEKAALIEGQINRDVFLDHCHAQNRYSNCYLVNSGQGLVAPLYGSSGEDLGYISLEKAKDNQIPDVVDLRQLEFLFQQVASSLESTEVYESLARNNADLQVASEKLNSLSDMKNNFVANVSHELRTPLTSISAYAELLQQNMGSMTEEVRKEFLKVIYTESLKLTDIINDILELGKMENGPNPVSHAEVDLVNLVKRLTDSWSSRAQDMNIKVEVMAPDHGLAMPADGLLLQQLVSHLLSNAFKFTPDGGKVSVRVEETGTAVRLVVEDTGIGIPEDKLGDIFDRFFQVDGSATRKHNGQGVGLAICQDIVSHHDGRIWAENMEPTGSRFTVLLPRRPVVMQPVDPEVVSTTPFQPGEFMQRVMHWVSESLGVQTATLMVPDSEEEYLGIRAAVGLPETVVQSTRVRKGSGISGQVWEKCATIMVEDITHDTNYGREFNEPRYSTSSLLCVPLPWQGQCLGVITVNNRFDGQALDNDDRILLESMAPILADLVNRHAGWQRDASHFSGIRDTLRSITAVGHLRQESLLETCQEICLATARKINMSEDDLRQLAFALQFYDVGLGFVPRQLLNKPGPLDPDEQRIVRLHVKKCLKVLEPLNPGSKLRQLILHHHENVDGSGYPVGLSGEAIPLGSRLLRLTDTLAALLSSRPWRPARSLDEAIQEITQEMGTHFCPRMTGLFLEEALLRRDRIEDQQGRGMDHRVFKRPVLDPAQMSPLST